MILVHCSCGQVLRASTGFAGKKVTCASCRRAITIPLAPTPLGNAATVQDVDGMIALHEAQSIPPARRLQTRQPDGSASSSAAND
jgi:hypothetical protein